MVNQPRATSPSLSDFQFKLGVATIGPLVADASGKPDPRRFSGIAYTGEPILNHPYWGTLAMDLSLMKVPERMPILLNHEDGKIVGYSDQSTVTETGLLLEGVLSKATEHGREVAALSDEGFPWQMSVRIDPSRIEELTSGAFAFVNGRTVDGPAFIFRESTLAETSFTPIGWDSGTSATALSLINNPTQQEDKNMSKELEDKLAKLEGELASKDAKITALSSELDGIKLASENKDREARLSKIEDFYKSINRPFTEDDRTKFAKLNLDDAAVSTMIEMAKFSVPKMPNYLFSHQAKGETSEKPVENAGTQLVKMCEEQASKFKA